MRLLRRRGEDDYSLTHFIEGTIPAYAVLSHKWGQDDEEVTLKDITNGTGKEKAGYRKIQLCAEQVARDSLEYFWVDSCCIDKENYAELSHAINSMFRWYRNAARCYVYLQDVSQVPAAIEDTYGRTNPMLWELEFQKSEWFSRGWTLQELLAPSTVEFFSQHWERIGDKISLKQQIREATGIPDAALQGARLSSFSEYERFSWMERRQTKLAVDRAYALLGIFDVNIMLNYDEGAESAFRRLQEEIDKMKRCLQDLRLTDPRHDKKRIEETKDGLVKDSYHWILGNSEFQQWLSDQKSRMLWIKGNPGKGKTMLLCGIINELEESAASTALIAYFFCQATDSRINSATAVLRGLLYSLIDQQPSLVSYIRAKYDHAGRALFDDVNAWVALCEIFTNILQDPGLGKTYLVIDALDECVVDQQELLDLVVKQSCSASSRVKWMVSSRNWPEIEQQLAKAGQDNRVALSLELNAESVASAVDVFIQQKVKQLAQNNRYDASTMQVVHDHLSSNADGTFLWVALVCQGLKAVPKRLVLKKLSAFPPGLDCLYQQMLQNIATSEDAELCKAILTMAAIAYRPLALQEMVALVEDFEDAADDPETVQDIISHCGSFLAIRHGIVYFVHQSAKDFLVDKAANTIFPFGMENAHYAVFSRSHQLLFDSLRRDMYNLAAPGYPIEQVAPPDPDPLGKARYSAVYWVDHLRSCESVATTEHMADLQDGGTIDKFLRQKYLYWLEALSLCKSMPKGVLSMAELEVLIHETTGTPALLDLVKDARRFIMYYKGAIEESPLQAYVSALVFSPRLSLIRNLFDKETPPWVSVKPPVTESWSACLQTLEGHDLGVGSVAFSSNASRLVSGSCDHTIKIWDVERGACLATLKGHTGAILAVAFSSNATQLASGSDDSTIKIWDVDSGACLQALEGHSNWVASITFSHDAALIVSGSRDKTVKIWHVHSGVCLRTLEGHSGGVTSIALSHNATQLASGSDDSTIKIWDASSGACIRTLQGHSKGVLSVALSYDTARLASGSCDQTVKIWDVSSGVCLQTIKANSGEVWSVTFSHDAVWLALGLDNRMIKIWDIHSGTFLQTLEGHTGAVRSVTFSPDATRLASGSQDEVVKIWDIRTRSYMQTPQDHKGEVFSVALSHDLMQLATASEDKTVKIWDVKGGVCMQTLVGHSNLVWSVAFSHNSRRLASASFDETVKVWDVASGTCIQTLEGITPVDSMAFSHDSTQLASPLEVNIVGVWDVASGTCIQKLGGHIWEVYSVAFSHDSKQLASASKDKTVKIWDAASGTCIRTLEGHRGAVYSVTFSHDSTQLASASGGKTVKIWDAASGVCLQTFDIGRTIFTLSFNASNSVLLPDIGAIHLDPASSSDITATIRQSKLPRYQATGLSSEGKWITYNSQKVVWLPSEYRPSSSAVSGNTICIGVGPGRLWFCDVDFTRC